MWAHEHTAVSLEAVWAVLRDLDQWPRWDTSMERVALQGPFAVGTRVAMTPVGQEPIVSTIVAIAEPEYYADRTDLGPEITADFPEAMAGLLACAAA